jgi:hypothetical protein
MKEIFSDSENAEFLNNFLFIKRIIFFKKNVYFVIFNAKLMDFKMFYK